MLPTSSPTHLDALSASPVIATATPTDCCDYEQVDAPKSAPVLSGRTSAVSDVGLADRNSECSVGDTSKPQRHELVKCVGIVAGWGDYPCRVAKALKSQGHRVVVAAIRNHASEELLSLADAHCWIGVCKLGGMQRFFRQHDVTEVCLAGKLFKDKILFHGLGWVQHLPDFECCRTMLKPFFLKSEDTTDDTLLGAVVQSFERQGLHVVPGTSFASDLLAEEGTLTRSKCSRSVERDIEFGWNIAKQMGGLDIGQSITVRDRTILSVEAVEGTDACIERTGVLCPRGGFTLVKVAKPQQDMRFDLPTIGPQTIERMAKAGGIAIAIEADKTILLDRERTLQLADRHGIRIVAIKPKT